MTMDEFGPVTRDETPPAGLWIIACLALLPFPASALTYVYGAADLRPPALTVLLSWSAMVLSFLGGVRWGMETALARPRTYRQAISVASALMGWGLLLVRHRAPESWVLGGTIAAFLLQWLFDHQTPGAPSRYPRLSTAVTGAACISLALCLDLAIHR